MIALFDVLLFFLGREDPFLELHISLKGIILICFDFEYAAKIIAWMLLGFSVGVFL